MGRARLRALPARTAEAARWRGALLSLGNATGGAASSANATQETEHDVSMSSAADHLARELAVRSSPAQAIVEAIEKLQFGLLVRRPTGRKALRLTAPGPPATLRWHVESR